MKKLLFVFVIILITISFVSCESQTRCGTILKVEDNWDYAARVHVSWDYTILTKNGERIVITTYTQPYLLPGEVICW